MPKRDRRKKPEEFVGRMKRPWTEVDYSRIRAEIREKNAEGKPAVIVNLVHTLYPFLSKNGVRARLQRARMIPDAQRPHAVLGPELAIIRRLWQEVDEIGKPIHTAAQIGAVIGRNSSVVSKHAVHTLGLPPRAVKKRLTPAQQRVFDERFDRLVKDLALGTGVKPSRIIRHLMKAGYSYYRRNRKRARLNGTAMVAEARHVA